MSLRSCQQAMWRAVRYDPAPADAQAHFVGDGQLDAAGRLSVYRNMYWYRQVDALAQTFPRLRAELGPEAFTKLCCRYIRRHPSQHPALEYLGRALPEFIARETAEAGAGDTAGTAVLARLEWVSNLALLAPDATRVCTTADVDPQTFPGARLGFVPSLHLADLDDTARTAFGLTGPMNGTGGTGDTDGAGAGGQPAQHAAVWRQGFGVQLRALGPDEAWALQQARGAASVETLLADFGQAGTTDSEVAVDDAAAHDAAVHDAAAHDPAVHDAAAHDAAAIQRAYEMLLAWFSRGWIGEINT